MNWNDFTAFWAMGGHAAYVWGSFAAVLLVMGSEVVALAVRERDNALRSGEAR